MQRALHRQTAAGEFAACRPDAVVKREAFPRRIRRVAFEPLVFLDESGMNVLMSRSHAWVKRGEELVNRVPMTWGKNLTSLGAIRLTGWLVSPRCFRRRTRIASSRPCNPRSFLRSSPVGRIEAVRPPTRAAPRRATPIHVAALGRPPRSVRHCQGPSWPRAIDRYGVNVNDSTNFSASASFSRGEMPRTS